MEGLIEDDDDEENNDADGKKKSQKSFSPSQPLLFSEKASLMKDAVQQSQKDLADDHEVSDLHEILGDEDSSDNE